MADKFLGNPEWVQRIEKLFDTMDLNKNSYLELVDWLQMVRNIEKETKADAALIAKLEEAMREYCAGMGLTPGKKSTREQFVKDMAAFAVSERSKKAAGEQPLLFKANNAWHNVVDTNHDGYLTLDEYRIIARACNLKVATADAMFARIDTNKDGKVPKDELNEAEYRYWYEIGAS